MPTCHHCQQPTDPRTVLCDDCHAELALELALEAAQAEHEAEA